MDRIEQRKTNKQLNMISILMYETKEKRTDEIRFLLKRRKKGEKWNDLCFLIYKRFIEIDLENLKDN
jgi:hypothetical protein